MGIEPDVVDDGRQALEMIRARPYDAVLMDVQMPKMDGLDATRAVRMDPAFAHLPIIAMTAHAMRGDRAKCLEAGMSDYVAKPIDQKALFTVLNKYLQTTEPVQDAVEPGDPSPPADSEGGGSSTWRRESPGWAETGSCISTSSPISVRSMPGSRTNSATPWKGPRTGHPVGPHLERRVGQHLRHKAGRPGRDP